MANSNNNPPVHEIRMGKVKACVWANHTEKGIWHNVTFARIYKDGNDWKESTSFGRDDLPVLAKVADRAHTRIFENGSSSSDREAA